MRIVRREPGDLVVIDGIRGRVAGSPAVHRRKGRQTGLFLRVGWEEAATALARMGAPYATRLWMVAQLQTELEHPRDGWVKPRQQLLAEIGLSSHAHDAVARLEQLGLIEVQRSPGKRSLVRLTTNGRAGE